MTGTDNSDTASAITGGPTDRLLAEDELAAVRAMLATQNLLGQGAPAFTAASIVQLMARLDTLSDTYLHLVNPSFKQWVDQLYDLLAATGTVFAQKFPALYLTWKVAQFPFSPPTEIITVTPPDSSVPQGQTPIQSRPTPVEFRLDGSSPNSIQVGDQAYPIGYYGRGVYPAFRNPCKINYVWESGFGSEVVQGSSREPWTPTANPPGWNQALTSLMQSWGAANTPDNVFPRHSTFSDYVPKHLAVLDPQSWTDVEQIKVGVADVWQSQLLELHELLAAEWLSGETYFYLLHLLIALRTGNDECQTLAMRTLDMACSSPAYPNDTFANQVVYAALMNVSDPNGAFGWSPPQRLQFLDDLRSLVVGGDPASSALQASLESHSKVQNSDPAYPMQDPRSNLPFDDRKTDTLAALDKSRQSLINEPL